MPGTIPADGRPFLDSLALIEDPADPTKTMRIDVGAISTATTRVLTMPDQDVDLTPTSGTYPPADITSLTADNSPDAAADWVITWDTSTGGLKKVQLDNLPSGGGGGTSTVLRDGSRALTADWDAGSWQIRAETFQSDVATGTAPFVVASSTVVTTLNADQVDGFDAADLAQGIGGRLSSVRVATTAAVTLATDVENADILDGVTLATGDRVLIKNQADAIENGLYVVAASGAPARAADMPAGGSAHGVLVVVCEGSTQADQLWLSTANAGADVVGTNTLAWSRKDDAGSTGLVGLSDVTITSVIENELLAYDAATSEWINQTAGEAGLSIIGHAHAAADITSGTLAHERGGLEADVSSFSGLIKIAAGSTTEIKCNYAAAVAPSSGDDSASGYSVGSWWFDTTADKAYVCLDATAAAAVWRLTSVTALADIDDVTVTSVGDNEALAYDTGTAEWINQTEAERGETGGGGGSLPVTDDTIIVTGNVDATKQLRFEVDTNLTTGATRVITMADQNVDLTPDTGTYPGRVATSTDNALVRFDGVTGAQQNSGLILDDDDKLSYLAAISSIVTVADGSTITFDLDVGNKFKTTLGGDRTLALTNENGHEVFLLWLVQDATGSRTVTWFAGISWVGGSAPTLVTTASGWDLIGLIRTDAGAYLGVHIGGSE